MHDDDAELIEPDVMLNGLSKVIRDVIVREFSQNGDNYQDFNNPDGTQKIKTDPAIEAMTNVINMINDGTSIEPHQAKIKQLIDSQSDRANLIDSLQLTHEYGRLVKFLSARAKVEDVLLAVAERGALTPAEALAFHSILSKEIKDMQRRVGAGAISVRDLIGLLNKVDWVVQNNEAKLARSFDNTNPQGREIVRKVASTLQKTLTSQRAKTGQT